MSGAQELAWVCAAASAAAPAFCATKPAIATSADWYAQGMGLDVAVGVL